MNSLNTTYFSRKVFPVLGLTIALILNTGCVIEVGASGWDDDLVRNSNRGHRGDGDGHNISKVFGGIRVREGESVGDVDSVNGSITMADGSSGEDLQVVNGSIKIRDRVSVDSIETVNGSIRAGEELRVRDDVSTVNGSIDLNEGSSIGGDVSTVNGSITTQGTSIEDNITTLNGDIEVLAGSIVKGDIIFEEKSRRGGNNRIPRLIVDARSEIEGDIHLYQEVILEIDDDAKVGKIHRHFNDS